MAVACYQLPPMAVACWAWQRPWCNWMLCRSQHVPITLLHHHLCLQPSAAVRLEVGEDDENPYAGQEGTQVTAAVTGALRACMALLAVGWWLQAGAAAGRACVEWALAPTSRAHCTAFCAGTVWEVKVKVSQAVKAGETLVSEAEQSCNSQ